MLVKLIIILLMLICLTLHQLTHLGREKLLSLSFCTVSASYLYSLGVNIGRLNWPGNWPAFFFSPSIWFVLVGLLPVSLTPPVLCGCCGGTEAGLGRFMFQLRLYSIPPTNTTGIGLGRTRTGMVPSLKFCVFLAYCHASRRSYFVIELSPSDSLSCQKVFRWVVGNTLQKLYRALWRKCLPAPRRYSSDGWVYVVYCSFRAACAHKDKNCTNAHTETTHTQVSECPALSKSVSQRSDWVPRPDKVKTSAQNKPTTHDKRVSDHRQRGREGVEEREEGGMDRWGKWETLKNKKSRERMMWLREECTMEDG